ncbi:MAG: hypothetical protein RLY14_197 [Planctomycetota bacterium]|jgi:hypothetical protein
MSEKHFTNIIDGEIVSLSAGQQDNRSFVIVSVRIEPNSFRVVNIGISPEQAVRVWRDLSNMALTSPILKEAVANNPSDYESFRRIYLEEPLPKKKRRKRRKSDGEDTSSRE